MRLLTSSPKLIMSTLTLFFFNFLPRRCSCGRHEMTTLRQRYVQRVRTGARWTFAARRTPSGLRLAHLFDWRLHGRADKSHNTLSVVFALAVLQDQLEGGM